jgi:large subunit ribosomal protein L17
MLRQQVTDFLDKGRMETTVTRAKEIAPIAEKMISLGKKNTLASRRSALAFITREDVVTKVFGGNMPKVGAKSSKDTMEVTGLAEKYRERNGGYTRITRIGPRRGDAAEMAVLELV